MDIRIQIPLIFNRNSGHKAISTLLQQHVLGWTVTKHILPTHFCTCAAKQGHFEDHPSATPPKHNGKF